MDLGKFVYSRTLANHPISRTSTLLGTIDDKPAIVTVSRTQLPDLAGPLPFSSYSQIENNDIYSWWHASDSMPSVKIDVTYPATETLIAKNTQAILHAVTETPELYKSLVVPYIEKMTGSTLNWVYAILDGTAEQERVLYRDQDPKNGFVMLPNSKWDPNDVKAPHLLILVNRRDLRSIRDLTAKEIPLLNNIKSTVLTFVREKYNIQPSSMRVYFHYQPSYYHLHVHVSLVNVISSDLPRSISLNTVLDMLDARPNGLHEATIEYQLKENHALCKGLVDS